MAKKNYFSLTILATIVIVGLIFWFFTNHSSNVRDRLSEKTAKAVVLTCMDFRFVNDAVYFLNKQYKDDYNKLSLAGASLGYNQDTFKEWGVTIDKHIELAKQLHDVDEVIVIDHMDCGAYRILYDNQQMSKEEEYELHRKNLNKFRSIINEKFPKLKVTTLLANIDGSIVPI
jgi:carbonic anhydrase